MLEKLILFKHESGRKFYAKRITSRQRGLSQRVVGFIGYWSGANGDETFISSDELLGPNSKYEYMSGNLYEN